MAGTFAVNCNHCGASLEVDEQTRFVTCRYCGTSLKVVHSQSSHYTEVLQQISERTASIADTTEIIRLQNELERLDREWMMERERYMIQNEHGKHLPSATGATVGGVAVIIIGSIWTVVALFMCFPLALFGLAFIGLAIWMIVHGSSQANAYQRAHHHYQGQRAMLLGRIRLLETQMLHTPPPL